MESPEAYKLGPLLSLLFSHFCHPCKDAGEFSSSYQAPMFHPGTKRGISRGSYPQVPLWRARPASIEGLTRNSASSSRAVQLIWQPFSFLTLLTGGLLTSSPSLNISSLQFHSACTLCPLLSLLFSIPLALLSLTPPHLQCPFSDILSSSLS